MPMRRSDRVRHVGEERRPVRRPTRVCFVLPHPTGEWGEIHGFANGYADPDRVAPADRRRRGRARPSARAALYSELQTVLFDEPMWLIAGQEGVVAAYRTDAQGWVSNPLWPRPSLKFQFMSK